MSYAITPDLVAKFNKFRIVLSKKTVEEFRVYDISSPGSGKNAKDKSDDAKMVEFKPDVEVTDSDGMFPMVIIERTKVLEDATKDDKVKKSRTKSVRDEPRGTKKTAANQTKAKGKQQIKRADPKKKSTKRGRPHFLLPMRQMRHEKE